jgi:hypothetical protein
MMTKRDWSSDAYKQARAKNEEVEQLMRSILKLFADGRLVYRSRTRRSAPVQTKSERLRRLRRAAQSGSASVA